MSVSAVALDSVEGGVRFYGGALEFWRYKGHEVILSGPYETGKTFVALSKLHGLLVKYPNSRAFISRHKYKHLVPSAIATYENKVLPIKPDSAKSPIKKYGGTKPDFYEYPNGSVLLCVGLDQPDKVLSAEFDFGYINQAEEIPLDTYEKVLGRLTGRAGNAPYTQLMADCNPGPPQHWILHRATLKRIEQQHRHNPTLFNQVTGEWTEQGKKSLAILDSLTGLRYKRGRLGLWVSAEGTVYEFDASVHKITRDELPRITRWFLSIDFGYTNPFVCQLWGADHDGRLYLVNEIYMTRRTVNAHIPQIKEMIGNRRIEAIIADHDAEDRATLKEAGLRTVAAKKDIRVGLDAVEDRLAVQGDGKPRLFVVEDACIEWDTSLYREVPGDLHPACTEHEFNVYTYPESNANKNDKEHPIDANNHGMDAMRYMVMYLNNPVTIDSVPMPKKMANHRG